MSRDEQNVLVVSYSELKNCLEQVSHVLLLYATVRPAVGGPKPFGRPFGEEKDSNFEETMPLTSLRCPYHISYQTTLLGSTFIDVIHQSTWKFKKNIGRQVLPKHYGGRPSDHII